MYQCRGGRRDKLMAILYIALIDKCVWSASIGKKFESNCNNIYIPNKVTNHRRRISMQKLFHCDTDPIQF